MQVKHPMRLSVFVSGRGSNMLAIMEAISRGELEMQLAVVVSDQPEAPAIRRAQDMGIPTEIIEFKGDRELFGQELLLCLNNYQVHVVALAGFMRILPRNFLNGFQGDVLNIHPSLLPAFKGLCAQRQALDHGVKVSGCTVHFVDEGVDTGPIICQAAVPVYDSDDEETLSSRILQWEHRLYPRALARYARGELKRRGRKVVCINE